jgi:hypothetical protein
MVLVAGDDGARSKNHEPRFPIILLAALLGTLLAAPLTGTLAQVSKCGVRLNFIEYAVSYYL